MDEEDYDGLLDDFSPEDLLDDILLDVLSDGIADVQVSEKQSEPEQQSKHGDEKPELTEQQHDDESKCVEEEEIKSENQDSGDICQKPHLQRGEVDDTPMSKQVGLETFRDLEKRREEERMKQLELQEAEKPRKPYTGKKWVVKDVSGPLRPQEAGEMLVACAVRVGEKKSPREEIEELVRFEKEKKEIERLNLTPRHETNCMMDVVNGVNYRELEANDKADSKFSDSEAGGAETTERKVEEEGGDEKVECEAEAVECDDGGHFHEAGEAVVGGDRDIERDDEGSASQHDRISKSALQTSSNLKLVDEQGFAPQSENRCSTAGGRDWAEMQDSSSSKVKSKTARLKGCLKVKGVFLNLPCYKKKPQVKEPEDTAEDEDAASAQLSFQAAKYRPDGKTQIFQADSDMGFDEK